MFWLAIMGGTCVVDTTNKNITSKQKLNIWNILMDKKWKY